MGSVYGTRDQSVKGGAPAPTFVILAGGHGKRLGRVPKGLIRLGGETVVERLLRLARGPRWLNANQPDAYAFLDVPLVGDVVPGKGAPGGVVTALAVAATPWVQVVAGDMPFVTAAMLEALAAQVRGDVEVVCFTRAGRLEPLVALYRRDLLWDWAPRLAGNPSLRSLVGAARLVTVEAPAPEALLSLNTPEDLRTAAESFRKSGRADTFA